MCQIAEEIHKREAPPTSYFGDRFPQYNERKRKSFLDCHKNINPKKVYNSLGDEDAKFMLVRRIIELGLDEEKVRKTIEERFDYIYGPKDFFFKDHSERSLEITLRHYPEWCKYFQIGPDPNFPEWENKVKK